MRLLAAASAPGSLSAFDFVVMAVYLAASFAIGARFAFQQRTPKDYFVAGRSMSWIPVALSLIATIFSAITFLATPAFAARYGLGTAVSVIGTLLTIPLVVWVFIPLYNRLRAYSGYEYLERRYDVRVRCMASGLFIVWRVLWMATALYVPCLALHAAMGERDPRSLYAMIVVLGVVTTAYTALGGMKAVIWTDVMQFCVFFGAILMTVIFVSTRVEGGAGGIVSFAVEKGLATLSWTAAERPESASIWSWAAWYFTRPVTVPAIIAGTFVSQLGFFSVDQVMLQRYFSTKDVRQAQRSFLVNVGGILCLALLLTGLGVSLAAFYRGVPPRDIGGEVWDRVLPHFASREMVAGFGGILVAALFAATMSSIGSGINSATAAVNVDFYQRLLKGRFYPADHEDDPAEERRQLALARWLTVAFGVAATCLGCLVGKLGDIITIANLIINNFAGPMLGMFLLGLFTRRASARAVLVAPLVAVATAFALTAPLETLGLPFEIGVSSWWSSSIGLVVTLVLGYGLSLLECAVAGPPAEERLAGLTWSRRGEPIRETLNRRGP